MRGVLTDGRGGPSTRIAGGTGVGVAVGAAGVRVAVGVPVGPVWTIRAKRPVVVARYSSPEESCPNVERFGARGVSSRPLARRRPVQ